MKLTEKERALIVIALGLYGRTVREVIDKAVSLRLDFSKLGELEADEGFAYDLQLKIASSNPNE